MSEDNVPAEKDGEGLVEDTIGSSFDAIDRKIDSLDKKREKAPLSSRLKDFERPRLDRSDRSDIEELKKGKRRFTDLVEPPEDVFSESVGSEEFAVGSLKEGSKESEGKREGGSGLKRKEEKIKEDEGAADVKKKSKRSFFGSIKKLVKRKGEKSEKTDEKVEDEKDRERPKHPKRSLQEDMKKIEGEGKGGRDKEPEGASKKERGKATRDIDTKKKKEGRAEAEKRIRKTELEKKRAGEEKKRKVQTEPTVNKKGEKKEEARGSARKEAGAGTRGARDAKKKRTGLRHKVLNLREKKFEKEKERKKKRLEKRKDLKEVSDRLKLKKEMASPKERRIIDNLAISGVILSPLYKRFIAYLIDNVVIIALTIMIIVVTDNVGMWLPYYVLVGIVYFTFIELTFGRGLGKKLLGIYVTNIDFEYITFPKSLLQALSKSIPILNIADGIYAVFNPLTKQRLGNKWSDTLVIIGG